MNGQRYKTDLLQAVAMQMKTPIGQYIQCVQSCSSVNTIHRRIEPSEAQTGDIL